MDINPKEALDVLRAFRQLKNRLASLGDNPSMESIRHIDELTHAYAGQVLSKNTSMESTGDCVFGLNTKIDTVIASLEGFFDFLKKKKQETKKPTTTTSTKDSFDDLARYVKEARHRMPNEKPVNIDGLAGGALLPSKGEAITDPKKLYDLLKKDYDVLLKAVSEFETKANEWFKWAHAGEMKIWTIVGDKEKKWYVSEEFDEAELIKAVKVIHSSRKKRPLETMDVTSKLALGSVINMGVSDVSGNTKHETGTVRIEPLTDKVLIGKLADLAAAYDRLETEAGLVYEEITDEYPLSGGDDQPYRYPPVSDAIDEAIGLRNFDWEAHNGYEVLQLGEDIAFAAFQKYSGIAKWLDRALNEK